ncbi:hypothetical protein HC891_16550 [Candidatus Gracilibacteria bacterium]|nr:hypothetical protein [Candidatus Gracilibacteria bacterium]
MVWSLCSTTANCKLNNVGIVTGGGPYSESGDTTTNLPPNTNNALFTSEWTGGQSSGIAVGQTAFTFDVPVSNGNYTVRLYFAELNKNGAGLRLFDVALEGTTVLANFDVFVAAGGINKAKVEEFTTSVNDGKVTIAFITRKENAKISAIEIIPAGPAVTPTPSNTPTATNTAAPTETPSPTNTPDPNATATNTATPTETATNTAIPTETATATNTTAPTETATATNTALPTSPPVQGATIARINAGGRRSRLQVETGALTSSGAAASWRPTAAASTSPTRSTTSCTASSARPRWALATPFRWRGRASTWCGCTSRRSCSTTPVSGGGRRTWKAA